MRPSLLALGVALLLSLPAAAQTPSPPLNPDGTPEEYEVGPADSDAALRAGFMLIDWQKLPTLAASVCEELDAKLLVPLFAKVGVTGPYGVECATATVTGHRWPEVLLSVRGAHPLLNATDMEGHRLFVFSQAGPPPGGRYELVLTTQAMMVGVKGGEVAAVQPEGFVRYRWNGNAFREVR